MPTSTKSSATTKSAAAASDRATAGRTSGHLLERYGTTWAKEAGFAVRNTPSSLFQLLTLSLLLSARIGNEIAVRAQRALRDRRWTTPEKMLGPSWAERTKVLNRSGYARYDERTSRMLEETSRLLIDRWDGDLRGLRREAGKDPAVELLLLQDFKGIGKVGATIFCREAQGAWDELFPYADDRALAAARRLGLGDDARALAGHCSRRDFPRLVAALIRLDLENGYGQLAS